MKITSVKLVFGAAVLTLVGASSRVEVGECTPQAADVAQKAADDFEALDREAVRAASP